MSFHRIPSRKGRPEIGEAVTVSRALHRFLLGRETWEKLGRPERVNLLVNPATMEIGITAGTDYAVTDADRPGRTPMISAIGVLASLRLGGGGEKLREPFRAPVRWENGMAVISLRGIENWIDPE